MKENAFELADLNLGEFNRPFETEEQLAEYILHPDNNDSLYVAARREIYVYAEGNVWMDEAGKAVEALPEYRNSEPDWDKPVFSQFVVLAVARTINPNLGKVT